MLKSEYNKIVLTLAIIFLLSKEIFSYDEEKVVALSILSFVLLIYFNVKDSLSKDFSAKYEKLKDKFALLLEEKSNLSFYLRRYWRIFLDLEDLLIEIYYWTVNTIRNIINKKNKNRSKFIFFLIKDEVNYLIKDQLKLKNNLWNLIINQTFFNLENKLKNKKLFSNSFYLNNLKDSSYSKNIVSLILNKLNLNIIYSTSDNSKSWHCYKTFFSVKNNI